MHGNAYVDMACCHSMTCIELGMTNGKGRTVLLKTKITNHSFLLFRQVMPRETYYFCPHSEHLIGPHFYLSSIYIYIRPSFLFNFSLYSVFPCIYAASRHWVTSLLWRRASAWDISNLFYHFVSLPSFLYLLKSGKYHFRFEKELEKKLWCKLRQHLFN